MNDGAPTGWRALRLDRVYRGHLLKVYLAPEGRRWRWSTEKLARRTRLLNVRWERAGGYRATSKQAMESAERATDEIVDGKGGE
jgi:hypothetical protein